jgi:hypothetical protein
VKRRRNAIVGRAVRSQASVRPQGSVRDLDEYLDFLARLRKVIGPDERPPGRIRGDRFLL